MSWKNGCDNSPEFDIDFLQTKVATIEEKKPYKEDESKGGKKKEAYYYPGFILSFRTIRDPIPKIIKCFFPCIILGIFQVCIYTLDTNDLNDRLANLSIVLLTYVSILDEMRSDLPEISDMTFGDKYLMIYICTSLFPILYMLSRIFNN